MITVCHLFPFNWVCNQYLGVSVTLLLVHDWGAILGKRLQLGNRAFCVAGPSCLEHNDIVSNCAFVRHLHYQLSKNMLKSQDSSFLAFLLELCAAAAAPPPPPTECRRRAGAVFVTCSRHVVNQLYVARFL